MLAVHVTNHQDSVPIDREWFADLARFVLGSQERHEASLSIAFVDDRTMRRLHRQYLGQDEPTDVLSFPYSQKREALDGEVVIAAEYGKKQAARFRWPVAHELALYVVHGILHLCGYDDKSRPQAARMRARQGRLLQEFLARPRAAAGRNGPSGNRAERGHDPARKLSEGTSGPTHMRRPASRTGGAGRSTRRVAPQ